MLSLPAQAGILLFQQLLDTGFRRNDGVATSWEFIKQ
jgi:hypothetical protein